jgi:hypothetical protein
MLTINQLRINDLIYWYSNLQPRYTSGNLNTSTIRVGRISRIEDGKVYVDMDYLSNLDITDILNICYIEPTYKTLPERSY